jgi:hypothetical protein
VHEVSTKALLSPETDRLPQGYWTQHEGSRMRKFLDEFAMSRNLNPLNYSDWLLVRKNEIIDAGVSQLLFSENCY